MILPRPIQDNPLIVRAFRTGFRRGPNSFRISVWGGGLALLVAAATFPAIVFSGISYESAASWLLAGLAVYTVATFVIGGLQRMLMSFLSERERGTFDFIHLSTLRPSSIVLGYLLAGQLLGYLLLCLTIPVMLVSASIADYGLPSIVLLILAIVGYAVMLSMIFLTAGFWSEKISDLKGSALVLLSLLLIALTFLARIPATSWGQAGTLQLFGILPVLNSLWEQAEGAAPRTLVFFGRDLPLLLLALITFVPLTGLLFHSLCRSIRYRDRRPVADGHALLTVLWVHFLFTGFYWGGA